MADSADVGVHVVVAVYEDPYRHRRTREVVATIERLGWTAIIVGPRSESEARHPNAVVISDGPVIRLLGHLYGPIARNLTRVLWTLLMLLPGDHARAALSVVASFVLRLRGLEGALRSGPDLVVVEDILLLPTVLHHREDARVVFDAREFFPRQFEHSRVWRLFVGAGLRRVILRLMPDCDAVTTVSEGLAVGYQELCGVEAVTVRNVPPVSFSPSRPNSDDANRGRPLRLVFHGLANPNRGLESLIELGGLLVGDAVIDLYLTGTPRYRQRLAKLASTERNVAVHAPVPFDRISELLTRHDMGIVFYQASSYNLRHALPSKFFEYLRAGLPVAIGPSPDMAALVRHYDCGVVAKDFQPSTLAAALRSLSGSRIAEMSSNARRAARDLVAEVEYLKLERVLVETMGSNEPMT